MLAYRVLMGKGRLQAPPGFDGAHPDGGGEQLPSTVRAAGSHMPGLEMVASSPGPAVRTGGLMANSSAQTDGGGEYLPSTAGAAGLRVPGPEMVVSSPGPDVRTGDLTANRSTLAERTPVGHGDSEDLASNRGLLYPDDAPAASAGVQDRPRSAKESPTGSVSEKSDGRPRELQMVASSAAPVASRPTSLHASPGAQSSQPRARDNFDISTPGTGRRSPTSMHRSKSTETIERSIGALSDSVALVSTRVRRIRRLLIRCPVTS